MKVRRGLVHVQHHVEHPEMGVALLKGFCELCQRLGCPPATIRAAAAVAEISDLEDGLMEQLLLLTLPDMLVIVRDLISGLFLPGVVDLQRRVKQLVIDLLQILVDKDDVLPRPVAVYIGRCKLPVIVPDAAPAHHAGNRCSDTAHLPFLSALFFRFHTAIILPYEYQLGNLFVTFL